MITPLWINDSLLYLAAYSHAFPPRNSLRFKKTSRRQSLLLLLLLQISTTVYWDDEAYSICNMHGNIGLEKNEWKVAEDETVIIDPSDRKVDKNFI